MTEEVYTCPACGESYALMELEAGRIPFHEDLANGSFPCSGVGTLVCEEEAVLAAATINLYRQRY